jgi:hypothetical protein
MSQVRAIFALVDATLVPFGAEKRPPRRLYESGCGDRARVMSIRITK